MLSVVEYDCSTPSAGGLRALVLSPEPFDVTTRRLAGQGYRVEHEIELFAALDRMLCDPSGYEIFVMDTDEFGGLAAGHRAIRLLGDLAQRLSVILIGSDSAGDARFLTNDRLTILRAPASAIALDAALEGLQNQRRALFA